MAKGSGQAVNCLRTWAREFRYDSGRARYLMRDLDLATLQPPAAYAGLWTDYARDTAYGDYTLSPGASGPDATTAARFQPGAWERQGDALRVHHGDQIGSSRFMTNASAQPARRAVYTAFGELVLADDGNGQPPAASRDGYAGAWGYETGLDDGGEPDLPPLPFLHVGERWYDPATGRFLQRDPIGIDDGLNPYAYVANDPIAAVDPDGRDRWIVNSWPHQGIAIARSDGGFIALDFYATAWLDGKPMRTLRSFVGCAGAIVGSTPGSLGPDYERIESTPLEDLELLAWMAKQLKRPPRYSGCYNCRDFAQEGARVGKPVRFDDRYCFPFGTTVLTDRGPVPIEALRSGDCAETIDPMRGGHSSGRASRVTHSFSSELVTIWLHHSHVQCTPHHPFFVFGRGWVPAADIRAGDALRSAKGAPHLVSRIEREELPVPMAVVDLAVEDVHTFLVGEAQVLVHNKIR